MKLSLLASTIAAASAATWYGIAPDDTVPGLINLFTMTYTGQVIKEVAAVVTSDQEYPKTGTLACSWNTTLCYFATGVGAPYISDAIYAVDRATGVTKFKHTPPAGIYYDNLVFDWAHEELYYVAFNPAAHTGSIVKISATTGNLTYVFDISGDIGIGFVFGGDVTMCSQERHLFVGVEPRDGAFSGFILDYDVSVTPPVLLHRFPLAGPTPAGMRARCNATHLTHMHAATIQADTMDRETALVGNLFDDNHTGLLFPIARGDLPTFHQRGDIPLFMTGMIADFEGAFIIPVYPPFNPGPGPHPPVPIGFLWTVQPFAGRPAPQQLNVIAYYLAGASGVPGV